MSTGAALAPRASAPQVTLTLKRVPSLSRIAAALAGVGLLFMLLFSGVVGDSRPAVADGVTCPFGNKDEAPEMYSSETYFAGATALMPGTSAISGKIMQNVDLQSFGNKPRTAYEYYGMSGLRWSVSLDSDHCWDAGSRISNETANYLFAVSKGITTMSISMYEWASAPDLMVDFLKPMDAVVRGLKNNLYLNFLSPIIVLGALWMGWQGLVKKRTTETTQAAIWMIASAAFALVFMAWPSAIAGWGNSVVSTVNSAAVSAVTNATSSTISKSDICYLPSSAPKAGSRMASCSIYKALAFTPWASGQFGTPLSTQIRGSDAMAQVTIPGHTTSKDLRVAQLEAQATNYEEAALGADKFEDVKKKDSERWKFIQTRAEKEAWGPAWAGTSGDSRVNIGFASVIASVAAGALILIISFSSIVLALAMILLIMMAPLFLLVGAHPGFGRGIALKWAELLLGTVLKRIVLGFMLAVLIGFYQVILGANLAWFSQVALIIAVGVGAIMFRKPMLEAMNIVNLGGSRSGLENIDATRHLKKGASIGTGSLAGAVAGGRSGMSAGGLKAAALGAVGGGFSGGISGSRSPNALRAGKMGLAAGRSTADRQEARRNERERDDDPFAYAKERERQAKDEAQAQRLADAYGDDPEMRRRLEKWAATRGVAVPRPGEGRSPATPAPKDAKGQQAPPPGYESVTGQRPVNRARVAGQTRRPEGSVGSGIPTPSVSGAPRMPAGAATGMPKAASPRVPTPSASAAPSGPSRTSQKGDFPATPKVSPTEANDVAAAMLARAKARAAQQGSPPPTGGRR